MMKAPIVSTKAHGAVMATRPASMPLAAIEGSGLPYFFHTRNIAARQPAALAMNVLTMTTAEAHVGGRQGGGAVEADPPEHQDDHAEDGQREIVRQDHPRATVLGELADPGAEHDRSGERGEAADHVHHAGAGEVDGAVAEADVAAESAEPAAAPDPVAEDGVDDRSDEECVDDEGRELPALGHRAGRDGRRGVHEDHLEEEEADDDDVVGTAGQEEARVAEDPPAARRSR